MLSIQYFQCYLVTKHQKPYCKKPFQENTELCCNGGACVWAGSRAARASSRRTGATCSLQPPGQTRGGSDLSRRRGTPGSRYAKCRDMIFYIHLWQNRVFQSLGWTWGGSEGWFVTSDTDTWGSGLSQGQSCKKRVLQVPRDSIVFRFSGKFVWCSGIFELWKFNFVTLANKSDSKVTKRLWEEVPSLPFFC